MIETIQQAAIRKLRLLLRDYPDDKETRDTIIPKMEAISIAPTHNQTETAAIRIFIELEAECRDKWDELPEDYKDHFRQIGEVVLLEFVRGESL